MPNQKITFPATEHRSAREAIGHLKGATDRRAILLGNQYYTVAKTDAERLEIAGVEFAYLSLHTPTGRIMSVPVNDR